MIRRLFCRWLGHRWSKGRDRHIFALADTNVVREKVCGRCGEIRAVKRRQPKGTL